MVPDRGCHSNTGRGARRPRQTTGKRLQDRRGGPEDRLLGGGAQTTVAQNRPIVFAEWNAVYYSRRGIDVMKATVPLLRAWNYRRRRRVRQHTWTVDDLLRSRSPQVHCQFLNEFTGATNDSWCHQ